MTAFIRELNSNIYSQIIMASSSNWNEVLAKSISIEEGMKVKKKTTSSSVQFADQDQVLMAINRMEMELKKNYSNNNNRNDNKINTIRDQKKIFLPKAVDVVPPRF
jgi:hypothetical protein